MKTIKRISVTLLFLLLWTAFIVYGGLMNGFLLRAFSEDESPSAFIAATKEKIAEESVGNLAMVLIENGEVGWEYFYGKGEEITATTVFQVASVSKWVTAWGVMKLVQEAKLDLDRPVDEYLTRWHLPKTEFDNNKVTIRRLLSHTAGLTDGLGYEGFGPNEEVQSLEESLTKASDGPYSDGEAKVGYEPGSDHQYSGASYTLLQLIIEEVTGQSFQVYMTENVFEPLGMTNSTFVLSDRPDLKLAKLYKNDGKTVSPPYRFTALAAASLYTCTADLTKFMQANIGENGILTPATLAQMTTAEAFRNRIGVYALGPHLYSQNATDTKVIGHDGSSWKPAINTAARVDLMSKNGIIILEMGNDGFASSLADEWLFWKAGIADYVVIQRNKPYLISLLLIGCLVIIIGAVVIIWQS